MHYRLHSLDIIRAQYVQYIKNNHAVNLGLNVNSEMPCFKNTHVNS